MEQFEQKIMAYLDGLAGLAPDAVAAASKAIFFTGVMKVGGGIACIAALPALWFGLRWAWRKSTALGGYNDDVRKGLICGGGCVVAILLILCGSAALFSPFTWLALTDQAAAMAYEILRR